MDYIKIVLDVVAVVAFVVAGFERMLYAGALSEKDAWRIVCLTE